MLSELNEAISELAPIEDQVNEAKSEKNSMASENSRNLKKAEAKIRSIRDKQRGFEHTYNQVKEYKTSRNDQKLVDSQQKADEIRETVRNEQKKEQESNDELYKVNKGVFTNYVDNTVVFFFLSLVNIIFWNKGKFESR